MEEDTGLYDGESVRSELFILVWNQELLLDFFFF